MARSPAKRNRLRGAVDALPSGALRVRVYAGEDPLTGKRHSLIEVIPPGPQAAAQAEAARVRLLSQVDERRNPRTNATVDQLLDLYLENLDGAPLTSTRTCRPRGSAVCRWYVPNPDGGRALDNGITRCRSRQARLHRPGPQSSNPSGSIFEQDLYGYDGPVLWSATLARAKGAELISRPWSAGSR